MVHSIRVVSHRTGLSQHVIRMWERRYGVVVPQRTETNRRLYSDQDIEKLRLLKGVTQEGHSIGFVAGLSQVELQELLDQSKGLPEGIPSSKEADESRYLRQALQDIRMYDRDGLEAAFRRALQTWGNQGTLQKLIVPLAQKLGKAWEKGDLTVAHEHFASSIIKAFLLSSIRAPNRNLPSPVLIVGTPAGQIHELGALIAATAASNVGWKVIYIGSNLPAAEIASAAIQNHARAIALSLVYPPDDPFLPEELLRLHELLSRDIQIISGGQGCHAYASTLDQVGAIRCQNLDEFFKALELARNR